VQNLETLIRLAKKDDQNAMLEIISKFQPLINKHYRNSKYNEDVKCEMESKLIELVKKEIRLDNMRELNDGSLVNYIATSLDNHYFAGFKKRNKTTKLEVVFDNEELISVFDENKNMNEGGIDEVILFEMLRKILTEKEYDCVYYIVYMKYTAEELAQEWGISRQACNQCKKRAFDKIRNYYQTHEF
jgi:DNA-directed RNA polymerase specialized sigma24 family protein